MEKQMFKDLLGREIKVGDTIVYAGRGSCTAYLRKATVEEIIPDSDAKPARLKVARQGVGLEAGSWAGMCSSGIAYVDPRGGHIAVVDVPEVAR